MAWTTFFPLHPWNAPEPLVVAVGDWACAHCSLNWQWAKLTLSIRITPSQVLVGTIRGLTTLIPGRVDQLAGVHLLEDDLADLGSSGVGTPGTYRDRLAALEASPIAERCERIVRGFKELAFAVTGFSCFSPQPTLSCESRFAGSSLIQALAQQLDDGADVRLVLHDALLDAGHADMAEHLARTERHPRGCWVTNLLLDKQ